ncbi:MAG TPA: DUF4412 domain-containing protein [Stellaceae bacterium]|nr:DUF4412 domain-containing protein [Stellaceae bacterium]
MKFSLASMGIALAMAATGTGGARAAAVITVQNSGSDGAHAGQAETIYLEADHLRMTRPDGSMIYREDLKKVWSIDDAHHSYREITAETMQQMQAAMSQAKTRMEQQLKSLPEDQRKRIEAMMQQQGMGQSPAAAPPPMTYEKVGAARTVGKWSCTPFRVKGGPEPSDSGHEEYCIARLKDVGLTRDDLKPLVSLGKFMQQMGPGGRAAQAFDLDAQTKAIGFEGLPVQTTRYSSDGKVEFQTTITDVAQKSVPANSFDLPAGYVKQEMSFGRPPGKGAP